MIINSIQLENFRSHKNTTINFEKGITSIIGSNGAGKSSILEAISYVLFKKFTGTVDELKRESINDDDIVNGMLVTLKFTSNGNKYQLERGKKKSSNVAELRFYENGKYIMKSKGDRQVTNDIEEILNMDSESFLNAVYIKQGEITDLIERTPAQRKEFISKLLNLDSLEKSWEQIKDIISVYTDKKNKNIGKLDSAKIDKENKISTENEIKDIETAIQEANNIYNKKQDEQEELKKLQKEMEEKKSQYTKLELQISNDKNLIEHLESQKLQNKSEIEQIEQAEKERIIIEKEITPLETLKIIKEKNDQYQDIKKEINELSKTFTKIENYNQKQKENKESHDQYIKLVKEKEELEQLKESLQQKENEFIKLTSDLERKEQEKDELFSNINSTAEKAGKLLNRIFSSPDDVKIAIEEEQNKNQHSIQLITDKIQKNKEEISSITTSKKATQKSIKELKKVQNKCPVCQSDITPEKQEELLKQYNNTIIDNDIRLEDLNNANKNQSLKLDELNLKLEKTNQINVTILDDEFNRFNILKDELKNLESELSLTKKDHEQLEETKNKIKEYKVSIDKLDNSYQEYILATKMLEDLPSIENQIEIQQKLQQDQQNIKMSIRELSRKVALKDDINIQIKYLEKRQQEFNKLEGMIINKEDKLTQLKETTDQIAIQQNNLLNKQQEIQNISYSQEKYDEINKEYTSNNEEISNYEKRISQQQGIKQELIKHSNALDEKIKENKKIEKEQEYIEDYIKLLNQIRDLYSKDGIQKELRNIVRPQIEKNTRELFDKFNFGSYSNIQLDEDYNITVQGPKETIDLNMLSGGEKIAIALALRLGITKVISNNSRLELLILDEPTIHLDEERRKDLISIIQSINMIPQMIVVSHDEELEEISTNYIKVDKINSISKIDTTT